MNVLAEASHHTVCGARSSSRDASTKTFHFAAHDRVLDYLMCGWHIINVDLAHHSEYGVLLEWLCDCPVTSPRKEPS
jgi:hypothetical protein